MPTVASQAGIFGYGRSYATTGTNEDSVLALARKLANQGTTSVTAGGSLVLNSKNIGKYEYAIRDSETINSNYDSTTYFTTTEDTVSSWIIVKGNLNIVSGANFKPPVRKLFTVIYATGNMIISGDITMTGLGANHSGIGSSGGFTAPEDIKIASGTFSSSSGNVINPYIPAIGGAGGASISDDGSNTYNDGLPGTSGGTGGGGTGRAQLSGIVGAGASGTCFSGGSGSGGAAGSLGGAAGSYGGAGGAANASNGNTADGGSGNPGGAGARGGSTGNSGTGGVIIIICEGTLSGDGSVIANGSDAVSSSSTSGGGASGGGCITIISSADSSTLLVRANGGLGNTSGSGGNGSTRLLSF